MSSGTTIPGRAISADHPALAALPAPLRQKMRLVHYPDEFDREASVIAPLRQGELVEVSASRRV